MPKGTVKKFFEDKGFGFITPDDGSEDVFVHRKVHGDGQDRTAYLSEGDAVEYEVEWDDRKGKSSASSCKGPWKTGGGGGGGSWSPASREQWSPDAAVARGWGGDGGGYSSGGGGGSWGGQGARYSPY